VQVTSANFRYHRAATFIANPAYVSAYGEAIKASQCLPINYNPQLIMPSPNAPAEMLAQALRFLTASSDRQINNSEYFQKASR